MTVLPSQLADVRLGLRGQLEQETIGW